MYTAPTRGSGVTGCAVGGAADSRATACSASEWFAHAEVAEASATTSPVVRARLRRRTIFLGVLPDLRPFSPALGSSAFRGCIRSRPPYPRRTLPLV